MMIKFDTANETFAAAKLYSSHPSDTHTYVVIRYGFNLGSRHKYVVHTYNTTTNGFSRGEYCDTWEEAITAFNNRGI